MTEKISIFIHSKNFLLSFYSLFFITGILMILVAFWIGQYKNIKKMDKNFHDESYDFGVWLNAQRAFSYGMAFLFPNTLAKRTHKKTNLENIKKDEKKPYIIFALLILCVIVLFILNYFIIDNNLT
ncbi:MAG TPA: hypothetical protein ENJ60_13395 [Aeromonadales bacterium]|nr:hypothetical protein [Aeromonadales bacterium]